MKGNQTLQRVCWKTKTFLQNNSSTILTCIGAVGVVATAVTAVRATPKALKLLEEAKEEKGEELTKKEVIVVAGPSYIPSILIGASTLACVLGANVLNKRQQASIASAYALIDNSYKEYKDKLKELYGEEADIRIRDEIAKDKVDESQCGYAPGCASMDLGTESQLFYDEIGERYFETTVNKVLNAEYHLNRNLQMRGFVWLNEFYGFLGLETTKYGDSLGWSATQLLEDGVTPWLDFDHRTVKIEDGSEQGLECCVISPVWQPILNYDE